MVLLSLECWHRPFKLSYNMCRTPRTSQMMAIQGNLTYPESNSTVSGRSENRHKLCSVWEKDLEVKGWEEWSVGKWGRGRRIWRWRRRSHSPHAGHYWKRRCDAFFSLSSFASNTFSSLHQNKNSTLHNKNYLSVLYIKIILFPARSQHMIPLHPVSFLPFFQVVHTQVNLNKIDFPIACALPCMDLFVRGV